MSKNNTDRPCDSCGRTMQLTQIDRGIFWCEDCVEEEE